MQLSTGRISTRRSANEHREQLVDMLQKNVVEALPGRGDISISSDQMRLGPHRSYHSQFDSFEDYLNSFVFADEEEVTPQEADKRAETQAELLDRIDNLKAAGRFGVRPLKPFVDPEVPKLHYNWLLEHVMTSSRLIKEEGKLQMARARKVSKMVARHFEQLHGKSEREQRLEEKRLRKLAKLTAGEVKKKWRYVEGVSFVNVDRTMLIWIVCYGQYRLTVRERSFTDCQSATQGTTSRGTGGSWKATS